MAKCIEEVLYQLEVFPHHLNKTLLFLYKEEPVCMGSDSYGRSILP